MVAMPRDGAIIFSELIGKTEVLRVTCPKKIAHNMNDPWTVPFR
jgi:hypothetical protein